MQPSELKPSYYCRKTGNVLKFYLIPSSYTISTLYNRCRPVSKSNNLKEDVKCRNWQLRVRQNYVNGLTP